MGSTREFDFNRVLLVFEDLLILIRFILDC